MSTVRQHWQRLMEELHVDPVKAKRHWSQIQTSYREPVRHYHTLRHIGHLMRSLERFSSGVLDPALVLAAFYHDLVYDPRAKDNELQSARKAAEFLEDVQLTSRFGREVQDYVLATAHHQVGDGADTAKVELFLDCDLLILAASGRAYDTYRRHVRAEYAHLSDVEFNHGRAIVLQKFLARPVIFRTPVVHAAFESVARKNIACELAQLRLSSE